MSKQFHLRKVKAKKMNILSHDVSQENKRITQKLVQINSQPTVRKPLRTLSLSLISPAECVWCIEEDLLGAALWVWQASELLLAL